jgi:hypothetical protein
MQFHRGIDSWGQRFNVKELKISELSKVDSCFILWGMADSIWYLFLTLFQESVFTPRNPSKNTGSAVSIFHRPEIACLSFLSFLHVVNVMRNFSETESKEKHCEWDPMRELTITSPYVHSRVDSSTFTMATLCQSRPYPPYAKVDFIPQSETLDLASG